MKLEYVVVYEKRWDNFDIFGFFGQGHGHCRVSKHFFIYKVLTVRVYNSLWHRL